jgi:hypothetical protein
MEKHGSPPFGRAASRCVHIFVLHPQFMYDVITNNFLINFD